LQAVLASLSSFAWPLPCECAIEALFLCFVIGVLDFVFSAIVSDSFCKLRVSFSCLKLFPKALFWSSAFWFFWLFSFLLLVCLFLLWS
jgi:hypothetical protein